MRVQRPATAPVVEGMGQGKGNLGVQLNLLVSLIKGKSSLSIEHTAISNQTVSLFPSRWLAMIPYTGGADAGGAKKSVVRNPGQPWYAPGFPLPDGHKPFSFEAVITLNWEQPPKHLTSIFPSFSVTEGVESS